MDFKKWSALFVLALFMISAVPAVFADEGSDDSTDSVDDSADSSDSSEDSDDSSDDAVDRMEKRREELQKSQERLEKAREKAVKARVDFMEAREKIKGGRGTSEEKQDFLLAATDKILELLNNLKARVEASDAEDKEETLAKINDAIEAMTAAQATVDALDPATATREEIRAAAKELREAWKDAREVLKEGAGRVVNKRVGNVIQKMDKMDDKLDRILAHLAEKGYDVSVATDLTADYEAKVESAEAHWLKSKELFDSGDVQAANVEMRAALADIKAAHNILKEIVKSIRGTAGDDLDDAEEAAEAEDDAEDAADEAADDAEDAADEADDDAEDAADEAADDAEDAADEADDDAEDAADEAADDAEDADDETGDNSTVV